MTVNRKEQRAAQFGIVVIGRNEGERLKRCLDSCASSSASVVYVDSGSMDGSRELAGGHGATVVELDAGAPFSAARARNAGYRRLREDSPGVKFVQFVDADCELAADWLAFAADSMLLRPGTAIVSGQLKERYPAASIYNRMGEIEWNASGLGEVDSVGGIFMVRCEAFDSVGGFDPTVTAGEEPELCQRLLRRGWRIVRLERDMATHDLSMTRFSQWWRRMVRAGYGSLDVGYRFGVASFSRNNRRVLAWSCWLGTTAVFATLAVATASGWLEAAALLLLCLWPVKLARIALRMLKKRHDWEISMAYAFFMAIAFLPEAVGQACYVGDRLLNRSARLIEYKGHQPSKTS